MLKPPILISKVCGFLCCFIADAFVSSVFNFYYLTKCCSWAASHVSSRWEKPKADNVFQMHPEPASRIVGRIGPTDCTDTDIAISVDGGHIQNVHTAAPKGTSSAMWKAPSDCGKHSMQSDLGCQRFQMGCESVGWNVTSQHSIKCTNTDVGVNHSLHRPSALPTSVHTERLGELNPSSTSRRSLTQYKEQMSHARRTGTRVNVRRRNVVDRTQSNRISFTHVSPPAGNNSEGSSTANNEVETWKENLMTNGEGSANLVSDGEVEPQNRVMGMNTNNGQDIGGTIPINTSEVSKLKQEASKDPKLLDSIGDRLKLSPESAIHHSEAREDGLTRHHSVLKNGAIGLDHGHKNATTGQGHLQEDYPASQDLNQKDGNTGQDQVQKYGPMPQDGVQEDGHMGQNNVQEDTYASQYHVKKDGPMCEDHAQEDGHMGQSHVSEDRPTNQDSLQKNGHTGEGHVTEGRPKALDHVQENGQVQNHAQSDDPTSQDSIQVVGTSGKVHVQEDHPDHPTSHDDVQEDGPTSQDHGQNDGPKVQDYVHDNVRMSQAPPSRLANCEVYNHEEKSLDVNQKLEKVGSEQQPEKSKYRRGDIDTTAPFESVKAAVSMFGGIVDWKAHKIQVAERRKYIAQELRKANIEIPLFKKKSEAAEEAKEEALKELDNTKRLLEELKLNLERAQTEERQAKQDAELAALRVEEMEQGIANDSSVAAKAQLEVAQARHQAAVSELKTVKLELEDLQKEYDLLISERDLAIKNAKEAVSNSKEIEKNVEGLTIKLITTKEALESAHAAHMEAEEHRTGVAMAREEDALYWEEELKQSEEELEKINQQIAEAENFKSKVDTASVLLQKMKTDLGVYMEENHKDIQAEVDLAKTNLEEVKKNIETATNEVNNTRLVANSLNSELEQEKETLLTIKQKEGMAAVAVAALEADLKKAISEVEIIQTKEKEAREKTVELPKTLEKAAEEADQAKLRAKKAHEELQKAKEAAELAKDGENKMLSKLQAALKDIEATRASERLALGAMSALHESESAKKSETGVTLSVDEYYELSRKAKEAEDQANNRVSEAMSQIDLANESELKALNKLEELNSDLASKKEQLSTAMQDAERAKEAKLAVEQELKTWRSENEQRRKAKDSSGHRSGKSAKWSSEGSKEVTSTDIVKVESNNGIGSSAEGKPRKKKRRSFFPRFFMFFSRKKHSNKNTNTNTTTNV
ncbi:weak chloroplast movement under blue light 1-like protein [Tanacetum coccineum]